MMTESARQAQAILRDPSHFQWYVVPLLLIVLYIYSVEVERKNWSILFGGLALWGMDWFNEIWNALFFHFNKIAPVWGTPGATAYNILIGLNIEITLMFAIMGVYACKMLPKDKKLKILGLPNRWFFAILNALLAVGIEVVLNLIGALTWEHPWWNIQAPWLIFLFGYLTFFVVCFWVHDMKSVRDKVIVTGSILGFDAFCFIVFGVILGWI
ncbi:MAG: hypothetical protein PHH14_02910 [Candidatus Margulisbacteria bacterium]|nr:hypothetical protein [Candidatus Margulisiibacteriota bacterium]